MDRLYRTVRFFIFKILRYLERRVELVLLRGVVDRVLRYVLHYLRVVRIVGYVELDFIQREGDGVERGERVRILLFDRDFQFAHCLGLLDFDREWSFVTNNSAKKDV